MGGFTLAACSGLLRSGSMSCQADMAMFCWTPVLHCLRYGTCFLKFLSTNPWAFAYAEPFGMFVLTSTVHHPLIWSEGVVKALVLVDIFCIWFCSNEWCAGNFSPKRMRWGFVGSGAIL
jgi:hypothetical protein